jgi:hypothetical protein
MPIIGGVSDETRKFGVTISEEPAEPVRACIGRGGFSADVSEALAREIERDNLRELITAAESQHGPVDHAAVEAKGALLREEPTPQNGDHASTA